MCFNQTIAPKYISDLKVIEKSLRLMSNIRLSLKLYNMFCSLSRDELIVSETKLN